MYVCAKSKILRLYVRDNIRVVRLYSGDYIISLIISTLVSRWEIHGARNYKYWLLVKPNTNYHF